MLIKLYEENPDQRRIDQAVETLRNGGVIIYPTDTVYSIGCDIMNQKAVEQVARLKGIKVEKSHFSFVSYDLSELSDYTRPIPNNIFKLMRRNLPGPFTFILNANNNVPRYFKGKKKTVGIRVPDNNIARTLVKELGNPIFATSLHSSDKIEAFLTDPELIHEEFKDQVDLVIDGGFGDNRVSTIIDCTADEPVITRQGKGELLY
ncbi:L-threonylcarbamoyladenylate synthase [Roseimarinus sediminis]|jgi:tRNA threonylcarbamoyl adenosine modification protein (Sua5/YciO/YrdC/YwlC family)|uniref:L-threonylcarbamoyladenylate synthase n=1 Tax=Roseimarinus sediminis TaxID=1610899 RepID=UPI003D20A6FA